MALFYSVRQFEEMEMESSLPLWRQILLASAEESGITPEQSLEKMNAALDAMIAADADYDPGQLSHSRLIGGDAERMRQYVERGETICGDFVGRVLTGAIRMGECNACMHRIVAAPTAGACGVMPAVLLPYAAEHDTPREELIAALYIAAGFGMVIASRASMSGAEAGCQAEIGTASAMAAAALVYLHGGDVRQMSAAVAIALKNMMGLVCDPVAGLVEVPCVKRNAAGAMNALGAAEMALAGIRSRIPADEVIDAMRAVGAMMSPQLKETGQGGVASSPTAVRFRNDFFGKGQE
ncbi:MAG: L-serine ammonia-lyase, iron-sulfur-dependent, subunit alpha [Oscillospiraceae bacterium]|nr:L-serine ammonia-lyase, iron-sulfur-dependent, subunit alpha [Oscillospiraceae bacterium]